MKKAFCAKPDLPDEIKHSWLQAARYSPLGTSAFLASSFLSQAIEVFVESQQMIQRVLVGVKRRLIGSGVGRHPRAFD
jgi:hypothetical protein